MLLPFFLLSEIEMETRGSATKSVGWAHEAMRVPFFSDSDGQNENHNHSPVVLMPYSTPLTKSLTVPSYTSWLVDCRGEAGQDNSETWDMADWLFVLLSAVLLACAAIHSNKLHWDLVPCMHRQHAAEGGSVHPSALTETSNATSNVYRFSLLRPAEISTMSSLFARVSLHRQLAAVLHASCAVQCACASGLCCAEWTVAAALTLHLV